MSNEARTVLVTGAEANTGFATVRRFATDGARVYLHAPSLERASEAAARMKSESGLTVQPIGADFRQPAEIEAMIADIDREAHGLDVLVNNAVDLAMGHAFLEVPYKFMTDAVAVNFTGLFLCSQLAARLMARRGRGVIINLGSVTSDRVTRKRAVYVATKGAIDSMTRAMAVELGPLGIRVNCVAPGHIHTTRWKAIPEEVAVKRRSCIPLGRESTPDDIAAAIYFLASDEAQSITGARLVVDGGNAAQLHPVDCDV